jgi:hypothetical protein
MTAVRKKMTEVTDRNVLTIRLPAELHEELRTYKYFADRSINDVVVELIRDFMNGQDVRKSHGDDRAGQVDVRRGPGEARRHVRSVLPLVRMDA